MNTVVIEMIVFALLVFFAGFLEAAKIAISSIGENRIDELTCQIKEVESGLTRMSQNMFHNLHMIRKTAREVLVNKEEKESAHF